MDQMPDRRRGVGGVLADVRRLDVWLDVAVVVLTVASAARYVDGHGFADRAAAVLGGATLLLIGYLARRWSPWRSTGAWAPAWCMALVVVWFVLVLLAP